MNRDELKQRLIELLSEPIVIDSHGIPGYQIQITEKPANILVDHLIANGVTIRQRGEWKDNHCTVCGMTPIDEENWTRCDITPPKCEWCMDFCPNCGADLRGDAE